MVGVSLLSVFSFYSSVFVEVQGPPELCPWPICDNLFFIFSCVFKSCCINEDGAVCFVCEGATCVRPTECFGLMTVVSSLKKKKWDISGKPKSRCSSFIRPWILNNSGSLEGYVRLPILFSLSCKEFLSQGPHYSHSGASGFLHSDS